ncbi:ADP-ribose 1''-phosphate phosphatase [Teratosphaeriaceae sp. CCFEE 6253]|nr:ADP-ribose 1''-phosphate phosphatase [Teratosphaeriaceae sp. CCFEE 6253]
MRGGSSASAARKREAAAPSPDLDLDQQPAKRARSEITGPAPPVVPSTPSPPPRSKPTATGSVPSAPPAPQPTSPDSPRETLLLTEEPGDIFAAPPHTLLIHACNAAGSWGAGIALAFKSHYPAAFATYSQHCQHTNVDTLLGTALLIPPSKGEMHFVRCLFTSRHFGRRKDAPAKILAATGPAMEDLLRRVGEFNAGVGEAGGRVGEVRICRINSGLFKVPWAKTRAVLEGLDVRGSEVKEVKVVSPAD